MRVERDCIDCKKPYLSHGAGDRRCLPCQTASHTGRVDRGGTRLSNRAECDKAYWHYVRDLAALKALSAISDTDLQVTRDSQDDSWSKVAGAELARRGL